MDPFTALGAASNNIQIADFSLRIISRGHKIYSSIDGKLDSHAVLDNAAKNLEELSNELRSNDMLKRRKLGTADAQLVALWTECGTVTKKIHEALRKLRVSSGNRKWQSTAVALRSIFSDKEINGLESKLNNIRTQINTAVLVSLR